MSAEAIAKALSGRKAGGGWMAHCPAHDDREPSLSITDAKDGKVLVRCHAGCDQRQVIAALRSCRVWNTEGHHEGRSLRKTDHRRITAPDPEALKRTEAALAIWNASRPAVGTPVAIYLRSRGLIAPPPPPAIRFHAGLKQPTTKGRLSPL